MYKKKGGGNDINLEKMDGKRMEEIENELTLLWFVTFILIQVPEVKKI